MDGAEQIGRRELVRLTPLLLVKVLLIILAVEFGVMLTLPLLHLRSAVLENIVDSFLLVALSVVPLHLLVLRPTMRLISKSVAHHEHLSSKSVRESEARHRLLFDGSRDALMTLNPPSWKFTAGNPAAVELYGVRDEAAFTELGPCDVSPERQPDGSFSATKVREAIKVALREGSHFFEWMHRRLNGTDFHACVMLTRLDMAGKQFLQATVRDITANKLAEGKLRESEERFRIMADGVPTAMWTTDGKGQIQFINRAYREFSGLSYEQVEGSRWQLALHPEDTAEYVAALQRAIREQMPFRAEVRVRNADGAWRWFATYADPRFSGSGEFLGHVGLSLDITERKQGEQALQDSEEKFRQLANNVSEVFWMMPPAANEMLYISPAYEQVWGRTCDSLYQNPMSWAEAIHPDDLEQAHLMFARQIQGELVDSVYRIRTPEGLEKWIRDRAFPIRDEGGQLIRVVGVAEDITERKRVEGELRKIASVVEASTDFVGFASLDGQVQYVNQAGRRMVGLDDEVSVGGMSIVDLVANEERADFASSTLPALLSDARWEGETGLKHLRTGARIPMWQSIFLLTDPQTNRGTGMATICRDLTQRKREEDELRTAMQTAVAATRSKSEFLANMSHEIRTPMNGVIGMLQLLCETDLTPEQGRFARVAQDSGRSLLTLIDDILDLSKLDAQKTVLENLCFNPHDAVEDVVQLMQVQASGKGLSLRVHVSPDTPRRISGDAHRLRQVLTNLVGNAIKFTESGQVMVEAALDSPCDHVARIRFSVTDSGIGIRADRVTALFSPFTQADSSTTRKYGGTGLGLAICKHLVEMMGGTIGVDSQEGRGSTFSFTAVFDVVPVDEQQPSSTRQDRHLGATVSADLNKRAVRLLVAEDNATNREVVLAQLQKLGYQASAVTDGAEAVQAVESGGFDLILMDCHMPVMDGFEATRCIRSAVQPGIANLPIIAFTADAMSDDRDRCLAEGMNDYLAKPVELGSLRFVLAKWLPVSNASAGPKALKPFDGQLTQTVFDAEDLLRRVMGDRQLASSVIKGFLERAPAELNELRSRLVDSDAPGARLKAHQIKGAAATVSANGLSAIARAIEREGAAGQFGNCLNLLPGATEELERFKSTLERAGWA